MIVRGVTGEVAAAIARAGVRRYLSESELRRHRCLDKHQRLDFLSGRVALKAAARESCGLPDSDPAQPVVENTSDGRPRVAWEDGPSCLCVSLAHSHGWGIAAVSDRLVGVDLERVRPRAADLLRYIADESEVETLHATSLRALTSPSGRGAGGEGTGDLIAAIWTIKEAVLKGLGLRLEAALGRLGEYKIRPYMGQDGHAFLVEPPDGSTWTAYTYRATVVAVPDGLDRQECLSYHQPGEYRFSVATRGECRERPDIGWYQPPDIHTAHDPMYGRGA